MHLETSEGKMGDCVIGTVEPSLNLNRFQIDWPVPAAERAVPAVPAAPRAQVHPRAAGPVPRSGLLRPRRVRLAPPAGQGLANQERHHDPAEFGAELCVSIIG